MKHLLRLAVGCTLALLALALGLADLAGAGGAAAVTRATPAAVRERPVIVEVTGDAANGFAISYAGGATSYPPTGSEARAECSEYDTRVARVRCRVKVRTWYRDLGDLQRSLAHAHGEGR